MSVTLAGASSCRRRLVSEEGAERLWGDYFHRLLALVTRELRGVSRADADEEDAALSAIAGFWLAARQGRFRQLERDSDIWFLLTLIAKRKVANRRKYVRRQKRAGHRTEADLALAEDDAPVTDADAGEGFSPLVAAAAVEEFGRLIDSLDDHELRQIAVWKCSGYSNAEIAAEVGRTQRTVERKVGLIRKRLAQFLEERDG